MGGLALGPGGGGFDQNLHGIATLLNARCKNRPDAFAAALAFRTAGALRDVPINDHEAQGLFGQVVRRLDPGCADELEVGLAMLGEAFGDRLGLPTRWHPRRGRADDLVTDLAQLGRQRGRGFGVRQGRQVFQITNQVRQAKLHEHVTFAHVLAIGREVVASERPDKTRRPARPRQMARPPTIRAGSRQAREPRHNLISQQQCPPGSSVPFLLGSQSFDRPDNTSRRGVRTRVSNASRLCQPRTGEELAPTWGIGPSLASAGARDVSAWACPSRL